MTNRIQKLFTVNAKRGSSASMEIPFGMLDRVGWALLPQAAATALSEGTFGSMGRLKKGAVNVLGRYRAQHGSRAGRGDYFTLNTGVAIVPIVGVLIKGGGSYGYADPSEITAAVKAATRDTAVKSIALFIDSPGGTVAGTADAAEAVREASAVKPIIAYAEDMCASAAYWIASQARAVYSNGTASVGSIGIIGSLWDYSKAYSDAGIRVIPITTGKYKAAGDPSQPTTTEMRDYVQAQVDELFNAFVSDVSRGRGISAAAVHEMQAAVYIGEKSQRAKLINGVVSFDRVLELTARSAQGRNAAARWKLDIEENW